MSDNKKTNLDSGFLFSYDWLPALDMLSGDEVKMLLLALIDRQRNGTPLPPFESKLVTTFATMIEPTIARRLSGSKGGRKANNNTITTSETVTTVDTITDTTVDTITDTMVDTITDTTVASKVEKSKVEKSKADVSKEPLCFDVNTGCECNQGLETNSYGQHNNVNLTIEQYNSLISDYGQAVIDDYIGRISRYVKDNGKKPYDNHYQTIRDWLDKDGVKKKTEHSYNLDLILQHALNT